MTVTNTEVIYLTTGDLDTIVGAVDPAAQLNKSLMAKGVAQIYQSPNHFGGPNDYVPPPTYRLRIVVINRLDVDIENRKAYDIHGYFTGQPVVMENGSPARKPSTDPTRTSSPRLGDVSLDWIDAPPPGYGSVGIWTFDQAPVLVIPIHGVSAALQLELASGPTVVVCGIVNAIDTEEAWLAQVCDTGAIVPDLDDFYNTCDQGSNPTSVKGGTVKVALKWQKTTGDGFFLFVDIAPTS